MKTKRETLIVLFLLITCITVFPQVTRQWTARYDSPALVNYMDYGIAITTDKENNVYVTGTSTGAGVGYINKEFVTIKYNPAGNVLWRARYSNHLGDNVSTGLAVDELGNVYVTGKSYNGLHYGITTLKYDRNGNLKWNQTFSGTGNGDNLPAGIVVAGTNNIYVAGTSYIDNVQQNNYVTISYDSVGTQRWAELYGTGEASDDSATAITMGEKGYIYVTGKSKGSSDPYFVSANIKYDSLGNQIWARRITYSIPPTGNYITAEIKVDSIGDMYLAGTQFSPSTKEDYLIVKYLPGELGWHEIYNGPTSLYDSPSALYIDKKLNVYVTGSSYGQSVNLDFATIKYLSNGDTAWVRRYSNGFGNDYPKGIIVDESGNVIVIGFGVSGGIIVEYDSVGNLKKTQSFPGYPYAIALDSNQNILVTGQKTGFGGYDLATIKYDNDLNTIWQETYTAPIIQQDEVTCATLDTSGNIYIGGYTYVTNFSDLDMLLVKYSSFGILQWSKRYNDSSNKTDYIRAITTGMHGNVYVTGVSTGTGYDYLTIKYNSLGDTLWTARYNGPDTTIGSYDEPWAIVVDHQGNVYVTGESYSPTTGFDWATVKYDSSGRMEWVKRYDGILGSTDENSYDLTLDHSGNIIVTGYSPGNMTSADFLTIKYDQSGDTLWTARYNGTGNAYDYATKVRVDSADNIYITGRSDGLNTQEDFATVKYDSNGNQLWVRRYDGSGQDDEPKDIVIDRNSDIYITGYSIGATTGRDFLTIKYNSNGDSLWTQRFNGSLGNGNDEANSIIVDGEGNSYVTGYSETNSKGSDFYTVSYDSGGSAMWNEVYNGPANSDDNAKVVLRDKDGSIYVAGTSTDDSTGLDFLLVKYSTLATRINNDKNTPLLFSLDQNYPNPFNPSTVIRYQLAVRSQVSLKIYDVLGREVTTLVNEERPAGRYQLRFDGSSLASGIYFYQLRAGNLVQTKKMILIK